MTQQKQDDYFDDQVRKLYIEGASQRQIAANLKVHHSRIGRTLDRLDLPRRPKSGAVSEKEEEQLFTAVVKNLSLSLTDQGWGYSRYGAVHMLPMYSGCTKYIKEELENKEDG